MELTPFSLRNRVDGWVAADEKIDDLYYEINVLFLNKTAQYLGSSEILRDMTNVNNRVWWAFEGEMDNYEPIITNNE